MRDETEEALRYRARIGRLAGLVEDQAWDGAWYQRGYFDDGAPLSSKECAEARIDSIAQSWAAISGAAESDRSKKHCAQWTNNSSEPPSR